MINKIVFIISILTFMPAVAHADPDSGIRLISVYGEAEVRVVPDEVVFSLGVESSNSDLTKAKNDNDKSVSNVIAVAKNYGIDEKHIQTDYLSIEPRYISKRKYSSSGGESDIEGYIVRKTIVLILKDLSKFEAVSSDVLAAGANFVHGIDFRTTNLRQHRDEARLLAVQAAKEKATVLAKELGQSIGEPYNIQENPTWWGSGYNSGWGNRWGGAMTQNVVQNVGGGNNPGSDTAVALGQIKVKATVSVSFKLN